MKRLSEIVVNSEKLDFLIEMAQKKADFNPACTLSDYWKGRMNVQVREIIRKNDIGIPYGYVGDGFPIKSNQDYARKMDKYGLFDAFHPDDWDTRDVGDAVYQATVLLQYFQGRKNITIVDIGAGYGRLAIPFMYYGEKYGVRVAYYGVDYVPESLLIAPQFVEQMGNGTSLHYMPVPAWGVDLIRGLNVDIYISIHSFQEMTTKAVLFYIDLIDVQEGALLYSINLWPHGYWKASWELVFDRDFPINRDGSYNERLWKVK
jgi:SAM-dependent methyltransferase